MDKCIYMFGGYGRQLFEEMRVLNCVNSSWKWELTAELKPMNPG
jgi:hypothetical protein